MARSVASLALFGAGLFCADTVRAETRTAFEWSRAMDTCDTADRIIEEAQTSRVIYSLNDEDPQDEEHPMYHGQSRGTKSVNILGNQPDFDIPEKDAFTVDLTFDEHEIVGDVTTWYCKLFKLPDDKRYHLIHHDSIFQEENMEHYHHYNVYECPEAEGFEGFQGRCPFHQDVKWPGRTAACEASNVVGGGWVIGGGPVTYPPEMGFPIGKSDPVLGDAPRYVMLEMHYDNPMHKTIRDAAGLRLTLTPTLRPIEAGTTTMGLRPEPWLLSLEPQQEIIDYSFWCPNTCLGGDIAADTPEQKITVFATMLHAHLAGTAVKAQHVRDGKELKPFADNEHFDFNYQDFQWSYDDQRDIFPGDDIRISCKYNTLDRTTPTRGGLGATDEMCLVYFMYYPRLPKGSLCLYGDFTGVDDPRKRNYTGKTTFCRDNYQRGYEFEFPTIEEPYEEPDRCSGQQHHPIVDNTKPTRLDEEDLDEWRASFDNYADLSKEGVDYQLMWSNNFEDQTVRFGVDVATSGYFGLGLSPNGGMKGADIAIGWVDDDTGDIHLTDRMASRFATPDIDQLYDFFDIKAVQYEAPESTSATISSAIEAASQNQAVVVVVSALAGALLMAALGFTIMKCRETQRTKGAAILGVEHNNGYIRA